MMRSEFTAEPNRLEALRQVESGTPPADVCRQIGVGEDTFYIWKAKYAHLGPRGVAPAPSLEEEHNRLKRLVPDLRWASRLIR
jgi:putative transposase